jgi:hypothetical protein
MIRRLGHILACAGAGFWGGEAWSAEVGVRAADGCADGSAIAEQAEGLLGRPLASVGGIDFEVDIAAGARGVWRLRVDTVDRSDGSRRTREIVGRSCAELVDAAAVAIALSVKASGAGGESRPATEPMARPEPPPAPTAPSSPASVERPSPRGPSAALGLVADAGALPRLALGPALEGSLRIGGLLVVAQAGLLPSQATKGTNQIGGDFTLVFGAALGCALTELKRITVAGCAGGEVGRISGRGAGVSDPRIGAALWIAGRMELGVGIPIATRLTLLVRVGAAVPASRPTFVVNGAVPVHRASAVTFRSLLGIELRF